MKKNVMQEELKANGGKDILIQNESKLNYEDIGKIIDSINFEKVEETAKDKRNMGYAECNAIINNERYMVYIKPLKSCIKIYIREYQKDDFWGLKESK